MYQQKICDAIHAQTVIRLRYREELQFREFEPHVVYRSSRDNVLVGGVQTKDESEPFFRSEPRIFDISRINTLVITDKTFELGPTKRPFTPPGEDNYIICRLRGF